jgi:hypothetical protein
MNIDHNEIKELLTRLTEGLNVEVKNWIDPDRPDGAAKIVKAVLALRNRNGGYLIIGFDDETLKPDAINRPADVRAVFQLDKIQSLISRYSSDLFEIGLAYPERDGLEYPVIAVPEGVRKPVAAKGDLFDHTARKKLVQYGDVYFRTLASNGTPSTAVARPQDWAEILDICFDNREADIGRFLRRHLGADLPAFAAALAKAAGRSTPPPPPLIDKTRALLDDGDSRFGAALRARPNPTEVDERFGTWSVALVIDPPRVDQVPDVNFFNVIASSNPQYTGWPAWLDSRNAADLSAAPKVKGNVWETLIVSLRSWSHHVDFFRMDPQGQFYLGRVLQDDLSEKVKPNTALDPILAILRTAEVMAVGLAFGKALGCDPDSTLLAFGFRWTRLRGRYLESWANPMVPLSTTDPSHDDRAETFVEMPLITPVSAIAPYVEQALRPLFALFGGYVFPGSAIEHWVQRLLERKLP